MTVISDHSTIGDYRRRQLHKGRGQADHMTIRRSNMIGHHMRIGDFEERCFCFAATATGIFLLAIMFFSGKFIDAHRRQLSAAIEFADPDAECGDRIRYE